MLYPLSRSGVPLFFFFFDEQQQKRFLEPFDLTDAASPALVRQHGLWAGVLGLAAADIKHFPRCF